jgi:hypothetical protein
MESAISSTLNDLKDALAARLEQNEKDENVARRAEAEIMPD